RKLIRPPYRAEYPFCRLDLSSQCILLFLELSHFERSSVGERLILDSQEGDLVYRSACNALYSRLPSGQNSPMGASEEPKSPSHLKCCAVFSLHRPQRSPRSYMSLLLGLDSRPRATKTSFTSGGKRNGARRSTYRIRP